MVPRSKRKYNFENIEHRKTVTKDNIKRCLESRNMSVVAAAREIYPEQTLDFAAKRIERWLEEGVGKPQKELLRQWCKYFGVDPVDFLRKPIEPAPKVDEVEAKALSVVAKVKLLLESRHGVALTHVVDGLFQDLLAK